MVKKILVLGTKGMVAHMVYDYLKSKSHLVDCMSLRDTYEVPEGYDVIVNCIGILVEGSEQDKSEAVYVNAYIPHMLEEQFKNTKTKIIHISTDCVYDGSFYGRTKNLGEIENDKDLTIRMSIIGADKNPKGTGLFNWVMSQSGEVYGYEHALWNGITNLELAKSIEKLLTLNLVGTYNLVPEVAISKYDLICLINKVFHKGLIVSPIEQGQDKTLPPGDKIKLPTYTTMLKELKEWIDARPQTYGHYMR